MSSEKELTNKGHNPTTLSKEKMTKHLEVTQSNNKKPFRGQDNKKPNNQRPQRSKQDFRKPKEQSEFLEKVI